MIARFLSVLSTVFPWPMKKWIYQTCLGYRIGDRCKIGFSFVAVDRLVMADGAVIGSFNIFRNIPSVELGAAASIGSWNWFTTIRAKSAFSTSMNRTPSLVLGREAAITSRHYIDVQDRVEVGDFSILAGVRSSILTHAIDLNECSQRAKPVTIGRYCFVGTGCVILAGSILPDYCVVGAGAVVTTAFTEKYCLYAGVPAVLKKKLGPGMGFFSRKTGYVD